MVVTDNPDIAEKIDILRRQGCREKYHAKMIGYNSRLDAIQAAILKVKLKYVDQWNEQRRDVAHRYNELLSGSSAFRHQPKRPMPIMFIINIRLHLQEGTILNNST